MLLPLDVTLSLGLQPTPPSTGGLFSIWPPSPSQGATRDPQDPAACGVRPRPMGHGLLAAPGLPQLAKPVSSLPGGATWAPGSSFQNPDRSCSSTSTWIKPGGKKKRTCLGKRSFMVILQQTARLLGWELIF